MKHCPSCGAKADDDSQEFCVKCGAYFTQAAKASGPVSASELPSDPILAGCRLMDMGSFSDGMGAWRGALDSGYEIDDAAYRRMLDSAIGCIVSTVIRPEDYVAAAVPDLARLMPDRELVPDLMSAIVKNIGICQIQEGVLGLANPYYLLFSDCFVIYPDLRDIQGYCEGACDALSAMIAKAEGLPSNGAKKPKALDWLAAYSDCAICFKDAVSEAVSSRTPEELDRLAESWASSTYPEYLGYVRNATAFSLRAVVAGRFLSGAVLKSRDKCIDRYISRYLEGWSA